MTLQQTLVIHEALDSPNANGAVVRELFGAYTAAGVTVDVVTINNTPPEPTTNTTDFITIVIPGTQGKRGGGKAPTLGVIGRNGAIGARPELVGLVSDADGPIGSLAVALKLAQMKHKGDHLAGDVIVTTHLSTNVSMQPHDPVPFMGMPVSSDTMNEYQVLPEMDAILSLDASKGNSIIKHRGFAISPTAMQGYILRVSPDLVATMESTTGCPAVTFPISQQDITPYHNGLYHFNSIMQPHVATAAPVVGVALTAQSVVSGSATSANYEIDIAEAVRFCVEVAKRFGAGKCQFFNVVEWGKIRAIYPDMTGFQRAGTAH
ncbi:DUF1177 domain-containing protein [Cupriavidus basilensis]|uniref:DUF1177 domain-containing protein n=1 Tax=Cupriavidus basilensis TaxID=68895 RepID=A0A643FTZ5_9BURK|nr:DUF1177 domain-containing protein [Cupriavidus basilensis]QOT80112.1 DUF1177 domain-containing protein [Cupriavidus basilensis]